MNLKKAIRRSKKAVLFIQLAAISLFTMASETNSNRNFYISGGPQIKYHNLNHVDGFFWGGKGYFNLTDKISFSLQGNKLISQELSFFADEKLVKTQINSGFGGIGVHIRVLNYSKLKAFVGADLLGGGFTLNYMKDKDFSFMNFTPNVSIQYPINSFISLKTGINYSYYLNNPDSPVNIYKNNVGCEFAIIFGCNY